MNAPWSDGVAAAPVAMWKTYFGLAAVGERHHLLGDVDLGVLAGARGAAILKPPLPAASWLKISGVAWKLRAIPLTLRKAITARSVCEP